MTEVVNSLDYEDFVRSMHLTDIALTNCTANRMSAEDSTSVKLDIATSLRVRREDSVIDYRYEFTVGAFADDQNEEQVAQMTFVHVATFGTELADAAAQALESVEAQSKDEEDPAAVAETLAGRFGEDVAVMAVYPYARATAQQLGALVGLPSVLLPILHRGAFRSSE